MTADHLSTTSGGPEVGRRSHLRYGPSMSTTHPIIAALCLNFAHAAWLCGLSFALFGAAATADRLRHEALKEALIQWQADDGAFTPSELGAAAEALNSPTPRATRSPSRRANR